VNAERALRAALRPSVADDPREIVTMLGGPAATARAVVGLGPRDKLPRQGTAARRRYNREIRTAQRYTTTAGQRRGVTAKARAATLRSWRRKVGPAWRSSFHRRLRADGARARVAGAVRVGRSKDPRKYRVIPPGGPGVGLSGGGIGAVLDLLDGGEGEEAAALFFDLFGDSYGVLVSVEEESELELEWIHVWVEGDSES
jgi:hypothetical protein